MPIELPWLWAVHAGGVQFKMPPTTFDVKGPLSLGAVSSNETTLGIHLKCPYGKYSPDANYVLPSGDRPGIHPSTNQYKNLSNFSGERLFSLFF